MRSFIVMAMFAATLAHAATTDFEEVRELKLDADGVDSLSIEAGAGSMDVTGVADLQEIDVIAKIVVPETSEAKAREIIAKRMILSLDRNGREGQLQARFEQGLWGGSANAHIALEVRVPQGLSIQIDDGSGSMDVVDVMGDVLIDDGSGSIDIVNVANVRIDDGSGSISVSEADGDVHVVDGSGSISIKHVKGSVSIDDGSGSIRVKDVEAGLTIIDDGSGSLSFKDVRGPVDAET